MIMRLWKTAAAVFISFSACAGNMVPDDAFTDGGCFWECQVTGAGNVIGKGVSGDFPNGALQLTATNAENCIKSPPLILEPGEKYRLSAKIKTVNIKAEAARLLLCNYGWVDETGISDLPASSDWKYYETEITAPPKRPSPGTDEAVYHLIAYFKGGSGEIYMSDVKFEPLTENARLKSYVKVVPKIFPLRPLLEKIPEGKPVSFYFSNFDAGKKYLVRVYAGQDNKDIAEIKSFSLHGFHVQLESDALKRKEGVLRLTAETEGKIVSVFEGLFKIIPAPGTETAAFSGKKRNTLVAELFSAKPEKTVLFINPRGGWVCFKSSPRPVSAELDGKPLPFFSAAESFEAMRRLEAGKHELVFTSQPGSLEILAIPEIYVEKPWVNNYPDWGQKYSADFIRRHILSSGNVLAGYADLPSDSLSELKERGLEYFYTRGYPKDDPQKAVVFINRQPGLASNGFNGQAIDEFDIAAPSFISDVSADIIRSVTVPEGRRLYAWGYGIPPRSAGNFLSAVFNSSHGEGAFLYEAYCVSLAREEEAKARIEKYFGGVADGLTAVMPDALRSTLFIPGAFTKYPGCSLSHNPDVDYKYFLDMQLNFISNSEKFNGLRGIGLYGISSSDEDFIRWGLALLRHYGIEGRRDMLSAQYGFSYSPGHLQNGDFSDGMSGWHVDAAESASVRADRNLKHSKIYWNHKPGEHETFCVLRRSEIKPNKIRRDAQNLTPGKLYTLSFTAADFSEVMAEKTGFPVRFMINASLSNAEITDSLCYCFIDTREAKFIKSGFFRVNNHRIVFKAKNSNATVEFSDWKNDSAPGAPASQELTLGNVSVMPYFSCP